MKRWSGLSLVLLGLMGCSGVVETGREAAGVTATGAAVAPQRVRMQRASLADAQKAGAVTLNIGLFLNQVISFLIIAFAVFLIIKLVNRLKREEEKVEEAPAPTPEDVELLREIRDLLKNK